MAHVVRATEAGFASKATHQQLLSYAGNVDLPQKKNLPPKLDVRAMDLDDKLFWVLGEVPNQLDGDDIKEEFMKLLEPTTLAITVAVLAVWARSHFVAGAGFVIDGIMVGVGLVMIGWSIFDAVDHLIDFMMLTYKAETEADLIRAADAFADAIVMIGVGAFIALITRGASKISRKTNLLKKGGGGGKKTKTKKEVKAENDAKAKNKKDEAEAKAKNDEVEISGKNYKTYNGDGPVFRGDRRNPNEIFEDGFQPKGGTDDLGEYVSKHVDSNYVSTSTSQDLVKGDYYTSGKGYVYEIDTKSLEGIDVNKSLGNHSMSFENEVAFHGGVPKSAIKNARQVMPGGVLGPKIINPFYGGGG